MKILNVTPRPILESQKGKDRGKNIRLVRKVYEGKRVGLHNVEGAKGNEEGSGLQYEGGQGAGLGAGEAIIIKFKLKQLSTIRAL